MTTAPVNTILRHLRGWTLNAGAAETSDGCLLERFVAVRDEAAFAALVERHGPMVWNVCCRALADRHAAEDAFQATFLILVRKAASLRAPGEVASWLYGVAYRTAARARVDAARRRVREAAVLPAAAVEPPAGLDVRERFVVLDEELSALPPCYRDPLVLCYLQERRRAEAARQLGWSLATLGRRLERGRALLQARLTRRGLAAPASVLAAALAQAATYALPPALTATTSAGLTATDGVVAASVSSLARRVMRTMFWNRLKGVVGGVALICVMAATAALYSFHAGADGSHSPIAVRNGEAAAAPEPKDKVKPFAPVEIFSKEQPGEVNGVAFSGNGKFIAAATRDKTVTVWDADSGKELWRLALGKAAYAVVISPNNKWIAAGDDESLIHVWDAETGKLHHRLRGHARDVITLAFHPDSKLLAAGSADKTVSLWNVETGAQVQTIEGHAQPVYAVAFHPKRPLLASAGRDRTVRIWDIEAKKEIARLEDFTQAIAALTYSPDGKHLATASGPGTVTLWDMDGKRVKTISGPAGDIRSVSYNPEGTRLATANEDNTVRIWDTAEGKELFILRGHTDRVYSVAFGPDGKRVVSGGRDGTLRLWQVTP